MILLFLAFILSGCATYKFQKPDSSPSSGYVVSYDDKPILEYTVGKEKSLPDLALAKERFKRRRSTVEYYYIKTGQIESRLREFFWDPPSMLVDLFWGVLRWPFIAVADYKYNHDPKYKERSDKLDEEAEALEKSRINSLQEKLAAYIVEDLSKESSSQGAAVTAPVVPKPQPPALPPVQQPLQQAPVLPAAQEGVAKTGTLEATQVITPKAEAALTAVQATSPVTEPAPATPAAMPVEIKPVEQAPLIKPAPEPPVAVIIAKPMKGYSPLTVKFSGQKSYSKSSRIVSYLWDFGDGDTSTKKNPENTYWSTTFGARNFTVTLTVKDVSGATSSSTATIAVSTP